MSAMSREALPENPRILCVKLADIGDVLFCTPALRALRARYPGARIDLLTPPSSANVLRAAPEIDEVIVFNKFPFDTLGSLFDLKTVASFLSALGNEHPWLGAAKTEFARCLIEASLAHPTTGAPR